MYSGHVRDYEQFSDEELARLSGSDKAALSALLFRYMGTAERIAAGIAPGAGREQTVKDLVQEGMMALLRAVNSYRPDRGAGFAAYAGVCIRHSMLSYIMKDNRYSGENRISTDELDDDLSGSDEDIPENAVIAKEEHDGLFGRIADELSEREWQVLQLFLNGHSYRQIAEKMSISEKSVNNTMQRVRKKLRGIFG
ncbi:MULTISPECIES: sigma-70 family RNA polymerase sigma factor [Ruminococcus]|uniref:RNA polymerase sigma factor SigS n=1 Tax=Ruminococcus albus (strain ATCC 27210 / DSM 20455 / JCM 14654 / NCDO 2250 / 7) TaxID=697329 RepID=E6UF70_RUMA7|nr:MULTISPECIES: sigma-70 family RNA polymerase sigma factor [Ruminococcus]ADU23597.1 transcriptional regulator, LuxR family [Ruminococcus albus 7 = DSM 20455]MCR5020370.1 sigma-70 family RNA polymerase sigma factor [Ruminococcus sp.]